MRWFLATLRVPGAITRLLAAATIAVAAIIIVSGYTGPPASSALSSPPVSPILDSGAYRDGADEEDEDEEGDEDDDGEQGEEDELIEKGQELEQSSEGSGPPGQTSAPPAFSLPPGDPPVDMLNDRFSPASITITAGEMITWIGVKGSHTATSYDGLWDSGRVKSGGTYSFTFTQPGVYRYLCVYHEGDGMVGEVIVTAPPSPPQGPPPTPPPSDPQPEAPTTPSPSDPQPDAPTTPSPSDPQPEAPTTQSPSDPQSQVLAGAGTPDGSVASSPQSSASSLPRTSSSQPQTSASTGGLPGTGGEPPEAGSGRPWGSAALPLVAGLGLAMIGITLFRFGAASKH